MLIIVVWNMLPNNHIQNEANIKGHRLYNVKVGNDQEMAQSERNLLGALLRDIKITPVRGTVIML